MPVSQVAVTLTIPPVITAGVSVSTTPGFSSVVFTMANGVFGALFIVQRSFNSGPFLNVGQIDAQQLAYTELIPTGAGGFRYQFVEVSSNKLTSSIVSLTP